MNETRQLSEIKQAFEEKRFGKIRIERILIDDVPHRVQEFFQRANFLVLRAESVWEMNSIEYTLVHPLFKPVPEGQKAPVYPLMLEAVKLDEKEKGEFDFETKILGWEGVDLYPPDALPPLDYELNRLEETELEKSGKK